MSPVNFIVIILILLIIIVCSAIAIANFAIRRRRHKKLVRLTDKLEKCKEQGNITDEQLKFLESHKQRQEEPVTDSCIISREEIIEATQLIINPLENLERDKSYIQNTGWAKELGINVDLSLSLKELMILSMKITTPREAIEILADILEVNMPINALEMVQKNGNVALPNYKALAVIIWTRARDRLSELISDEREIFKNKKDARSLLLDLMSMIIKTLHIPVNASGFAVIIALMIAKTEFDLSFDEDGDFATKRQK